MERNSYVKLLEETKEFYKNIKRIRCKNLNNELVTFGASGFKHLLTKNRKERTIDEQYRKLSLLKHVVEVINAEKPEFGVRKLQSKEYGSIEYISISSFVNSVKIRVILRKIGNGHYHFWSIMDV